MTFVSINTSIFFISPLPPFFFVVYFTVNGTCNIIKPGKSLGNESFRFTGFFFGNNPIYSVFEKHNLIKRQQIHLGLKFRKRTF